MMQISGSGPHMSLDNYGCSFEYRLRVALGPKGDLLLTSRIRNTNADGRPFSFTFAYHTYFSVSDIRYMQALQFPFPPFSKV
jgi:D-hexose-6-phosphate mutarotase